MKLVYSSHFSSLPVIPSFPSFQIHNTTMKFVTLASVLWGGLTAAQRSYNALPTEFLQTTYPNTPLPQGKPWGSKTAKNCNPYTEYPNTGVIRSYDFRITKGKKAPDGYEQELLLINNQFPGPLIEANWGDTIQVTVHNDLKNEGTSLHWHGLLQKDSPWMDGVPGISQCPIQPGGTFTYSFIADLYGTSESPL
jgi:FtsP/CotA-like multicopper oxidase with cupredoxin domain